MVPSGRFCTELEIFSNFGSPNQRNYEIGKFRKKHFFETVVSPELAQIKTCYSTSSGLSKKIPKIVRTLPRNKLRDPSFTDPSIVKCPKRDEGSNFVT